MKTNIVLAFIIPMIVDINCFDELIKPSTVINPEIVCSMRMVNGGQAYPLLNNTIQVTSLGFSIPLASNNETAELIHVACFTEDHSKGISFILGKSNPTVNCSFDPDPATTCNYPAWISDIADIQQIPTDTEPDSDYNQEYKCIASMAQCYPMFQNLTIKSDTFKCFLPECEAEPLGLSLGMILMIIFLSLLALWILVLLLGLAWWRKRKYDEDKRDYQFKFEPTNLISSSFYNPSYEKER